MKVRLALEEDLDWLINIAAIRMLSEEVGRPEYIDIDRINFLLEEMIRQGTLYVTEEKDKLTGVIGGLFIPNFFNEKIKVLAEVFWYVVPEFRGSRAGALLLNIFTKKGELEADEICFSLLTKSMINPKTLTKRGYAMVEHAFRKEV